jgi:hypothetical protein
MSKETEAFENERVPVYLFRDNDKYKDDVIVNINGKNYIIQRGVTVYVPRCVKNVLDSQQRMDMATDEAVRRMEAEYEKKRQKHE